MSGRWQISQKYIFRGKTHSHNHYSTTCAKPPFVSINWREKLLAIITIFTRTENYLTPKITHDSVLLDLCYPWPTISVPYPSHLRSCFMNGELIDTPPREIPKLPSPICASGGFFFSDYEHSISERSNARHTIFKRLCKNVKRNQLIFGGD